jgi:hypothetical protein
VSLLWLFQVKDPNSTSNHACVYSALAKLLLC